MSSYSPGTLGWWMDERRSDPDLRLTWDEVAREAGVSAETLRRNAKDGGPMRSTTRRGIERALRWMPGSVAAILDGGEPTEQDEPPELSSEAKTEAILEQIEALRRQVLELRGEAPHYRATPPDRRSRGA